MARTYSHKFYETSNVDPKGQRLGSCLMLTLLSVVLASGGVLTQGMVVMGTGTTNATYNTGAATSPASDSIVIGVGVGVGAGAGAGAGAGVAAAAVVIADSVDKPIRSIF